jgi:hypothetical protein
MHDRVGRIVRSRRLDVPARAAPLPAPAPPYGLARPVAGLAAVGRAPGVCAFAVAVGLTMAVTVLAGCCCPVALRPVVACGPALGVAAPATAPALGRRACLLAVAVPVIGRGCPGVCPAVLAARTRPVLRRTAVVSAAGGFAART